MKFTLDNARSPKSQENFSQLEQDFAKFECGFRLNTNSSSSNKFSSSRGFANKKEDYNFETVPTSENTPSKKRLTHSTKNSMNDFRTYCTEPDIASPLQSTRKNDEKLNKLFKIFDDNHTTTVKSIDATKALDNVNGYIFSLTSRKQKESSSTTGPYKKHFIENENKQPKTSRIMKTIQAITINLNKDKKPVNYMNRPVVRFDNKAELRFDMNYILESSPTKHKKTGLVTLEHLQFEKLSRKIEPEKMFVVEPKTRTMEKKAGDDLFFDFNIKVTKRKIIHGQSNSMNLYGKNQFNF